MTECVFCKIIDGVIPSNGVYEDDRVYAFADINPQAPVHLLVIPKRHIDTMNAVSKTDAALIGHMMVVATQLAKDKGISESGFRLVFNCLKDAGQEVYHLHLHLLGGAPLGAMV